MRNCIIAASHRFFGTPEKILLSILGLFLCINISHALFVGQTVYGDGRYYTALVRSLVVDHDLSFTNDYQILGITEKIGPNLLPVNKYQIGPALFWMPGYVLIRPLFLGTGYEFPYQIMISLMSVSGAWIGLVILYQLLKQYFGNTIGIMTVVMIAGTTSLLFYGSVDTVNSHAITFLGSTVFLWMVVRSIDAKVAGSILGLTLLTRPQEALGILIAVATKKYRYFAVIFVTALSVYTIQWIIWRISYGAWVLSGYAANGEGFQVSFFPIITVLFHRDSGIIFATPSLISAFAGACMTWPKKLMAYRVPTIMIVIMQALTIAWWSSPTQGASYGSRMFIGTLPYLSIPMAVFLTWLSEKRFEGKTITWFFILSLTGINLIRILWFLVVHP